MRIIDTSKEKIKSFWYRDGSWILFSFFISLLAFVFGTLFEHNRMNERTKLSFEHNTYIDELWREYFIQQKNYPYIASREGSYVYSKDCPQVSRIKEENRVFFEKLKTAEYLGYSVRLGC